MPMDSDMMDTNFAKRTSSGPVYDYQAIFSSLPGQTINFSVLHNSNPEPSTYSEDLTSAITNPLEPQPGQGVLDSTKDNWYHEFGMSSQLSSGIQDKRSVLGASVLRAEGLTVQSGRQFSSPAAGSNVNSVSSSTNIPPGLPMHPPLSTTSRPVVKAGNQSYSRAVARRSKWSLVTEELDPLPSSSSKTQQCSVWQRSQGSTIRPPKPVSSASVRSLSPWAPEFKLRNTPTTVNYGTGGTLLPSAFQSGGLSGRSSAEHSHYQASTSSLHLYSSPDLMSAASPPSPGSSVTAEEAAWWSAKVGGVLGSSSSAGQTAKVGGVLGSSSSAGQTAKVGGVLGSSSSAGQTAKVGGVLGSSSSAGQTAKVGGVLGSSSSAVDITRLRGGISITELGPDNSKGMVIMRGLPGSGKSTLARGLQKTDSRTKLLPAQGMVKNQPQLNSKLAKEKSVKKPAPVHQTTTRRKSPEELLKSMLLNVKDHCSMMQEEGARPEEVEAMIYIANLKPHQEQAINQYLTMVKNGSKHDGKADRMFDQFIQYEIAAKSSSLENTSIDKNSNKSLVKETGSKSSSKESSSSGTAFFDKNSNQHNKTDCSGIHNKSSHVDADSRAGLSFDAATNSAAVRIAENKDGGTKQASGEVKSNTAVSSSNNTTEKKGGEDSTVTDWMKSLPQREGKGKETSLPSGGTDRLKQQQVRQNSSEVCTFKSAGREEGGGDEASALMTSHEAVQNAVASEETSSVDSGITQDTADAGQTQDTAADSGENKDTADKTKPQENVDSENAQETVESITIQDNADSGKNQDTADKEKIQDSDDNEEKQDTVDSIKTQDMEGSSKNQDTAEVEKTPPPL